MNIVLKYNLEIIKIYTIVQKLFKSIFLFPSFNFDISGADWSITKNKVVKVERATYRRKGLLGIIISEVSVSSTIMAAAGARS